MEQQITWLVLTVALNTLFTGLIIGFFVRRLESNLGRKDFEYQTKYAETYTKRGKALETLIQKIVIFENSVLYAAEMLQVFIISKGEIKVDNLESDIKALTPKLEDLQEFYKTNRHFLSNIVKERMSEISNNLTAIRVIVAYIGEEPMIKGNGPMMKLVPDGLMQYLPEGMDMEVPKGKRLDDPDVLLGKLRIEVQRYSEQLEKLYKLEFNL